MKKNVIFLMCLMISVMVFGQDKTKSEQTKKELTPPEYRGGENAAAYLTTDNSVMINNFLKEKVVCPQNAPKWRIEGTEVVRFTVTPSGEVTDFKIINSVCPDLDREIIRILQTTNGMWKPGLINGNPISMENEVAFMFGDYNSHDAMFEHFTHVGTRYFKKGSEYLVVKNNPKKALKKYNVALNYLPSDKALLQLRGLCCFELGDKESAQRDWNRIVSLGGIDRTEIDRKTAHMKGYDEMINILAHK